MDLFGWREDNRSPERRQLSAGDSPCVCPAVLTDIENWTQVLRYFARENRGIAGGMMAAARWFTPPYSA